MQIVPKKIKTKTIDDIDQELQRLDRQLQIECHKCDGTGKPRTKTGEPAKTGKNVKCKECFGTGILGNKIELIGRDIIEMKKSISKVSQDLRAYINRQFSEIRVLPEGHNPALQGGNSSKKWENGWEDYTGVFYLDSEDEKKIVLDKAKKHVATYFLDSVYHRNKKLGIFISNPRSGKQLIEDIETVD